MSDPTHTGEPMQKVYISGQITGLSHDEYHDYFGRAEALLLDHELIPVNPLKVQACETEDCGDGATKPNGEYLHSWKCYLRYDIIEMLRCDSIAMLPNWANSDGANFELHVASRVGLTVVYINPDYRSWS
jgi:hypothetical protein